MKIPANITAYYPSDEGVNGGFLDGLFKSVYLSSISIRYS